MRMQRKVWYEPGDKVRMTDKGLQQFPGVKIVTGIITAFVPSPYVQVRKDGQKRSSIYHQDFWESVVACPACGNPISKEGR